MIYLSKRAGLFQPPPKMFETIWAWIKPRYAAFVFIKTKDIRIKEAAGQDCNFQPDNYSDLEAEFPLELEGWKYYDDLLEQGQEEWENIWDSIKIRIRFSNEDHAGQYVSELNEIEIIIKPEYINPPNVKIYQKFQETIYRNLEHELIHLGQELLKQFKKLPDAGLPSKNIQTPVPGENLKHNLRDEEFYSILNDAKTEIHHRMKDLPQDLRPNIFRKYVGLPLFELDENRKMKFLQVFPEKKSYAQKAILKWKELDKEKWEKAIKELYKVIKTSSLSISKRAAHGQNTYEIKVLPTEPQIQYFLRQGILYKGRNYGSRPDFSDFDREGETAYLTAVIHAYKFIIDEIKQIPDIIIKSDIREAIKQATYKVDNIEPVDLKVIADEFGARKLETHPGVRAIDMTVTMDPNFQFTDMLTQK